MATIIHDTFNNNRNPLHGTTPNTVDNGNTWEVMPTVVEERTHKLELDRPRAVEA